MICYEKAIAGHGEIGFKYGLTYWFEGKASCLFEQEKFSEAWEFADKCVKVSTEISKPDTRFNGKVLQAKIDFAMGEQVQGITMLLEMLAEATDESQKATLHYELWKMCRGESCARPMAGTRPAATTDEHRQKALELYQKLYEKTPKVEYKQRIEELLGEEV
jgi:tetratricopeptide (TPR) repeat protein